MSRKLASIQTVRAIAPIEGADLIEKITVLGWTLVSKKGEFEIGEKVVYIEPDAFLPIGNPAWDFLVDKGTKKMLHNNQEVEGYRLKIAKLRGVYSQGLALPLSVVIEAEDKFSDRTTWEEGEDVSNILGIIKYERPLSAELVGVAKGDFPGDVPKTDETRVQTIPWILEKYKNEPFVATEKLDGTSCTIYYKDGEIGVCNRSIEFIKNPSHTMWKMVEKYDLENKLKELGKNIAIQGEVVGEKIQKNTLKIQGQEWYVFNIYNIDEARYLSHTEYRELAQTLGLTVVPAVLYFLDGIAEIDSVNTAIKLAMTKSRINPDVWAEGLVFRPMQEIRDPELGRVSFKAINPEWLLKYD